MLQCRIDSNSCTEACLLLGRDTKVQRLSCRVLPCRAFSQCPPFQTALNLTSGCTGAPLGTPSGVCIYLHPPIHPSTHLSIHPPIHVSSQKFLHIHTTLIQLVLCYRHAFVLSFHLNPCLSGCMSVCTSHRRQIVCVEHMAQECTADILTEMRLRFEVLHTHTSCVDFVSFELNHISAFISYLGLLELQVMVVSIKKSRLCTGL